MAKIVLNIYLTDWRYSMKKILILFIFINTFVFSKGEKLGLVLSGGGAKGFAHIGLLKVLDEEKIPIDYIVGTSMGSIVGALYSMGYTAQEMEEIVLSHNWFDYLDDTIPRKELSIERKAYNGRYAFYFYINDRKVRLPKGAIKGQYIESFFNELYLDAFDVTDFNDFPIKFACVATDLETGEKVVMNSGNLPKSVRASMAIPTIFTPVKIDDKFLIDGMMSSNYPVEVAVDMGADVIIGSDIRWNLKKSEDLGSMVDILTQAASYQLMKESEEKSKMTDISIIPELDDYLPTDFDKVDELIALGEKAAREKIDELRKYKDEERFDKIKSKRFTRIEKLYIDKVSIKGNQIYTDESIRSMLKLDTPVAITKDKLTELVNGLYNSSYFDKVFYRVKGSELEVEVKEFAEDELKLGFNYNDYNHGEFFFNLSKTGMATFGNEVSFDTIIGENQLFKLQTRKYLKGVNKRMLEINVQYKNFEEYDAYLENEKIGEFKLDLFDAGISIGTILGKNTSFYSGIRRHYASAKSLMESSIPELNSLTYYYNDIYLKFTHDSLDKKYFSKEGSLFDFEISGSTSLFNDYSFIKYQLKGKKVISLSKKLTMNLGLNSALLYGDNTSYIITPSLGGFKNRTDSIEFWGLDVSQYFSNEIATAYNEFNYEFSTSKYIVLRYNTALFEDKDDIKTKNGIGLGLGIDTYIGPITFSIAKSGDHDYVTHLNIGYNF